MALLTLAGCSGPDDSSGPEADGSNGAAPGIAGDPAGLVPDEAPGPGQGGIADAPFLRPDQVEIESASGSVETIIDAYDDALGVVAVQQRFVDGTPSEERRYSHDPDGRPIERVDRRDEGGEVLRSVGFAYGPEGQLAALEYRGPDGTPTRRLGYEFDADGRVEFASLVALADTDGAALGPEGLLVERTAYVYAAGRLVGESVDDNGDGSTERTRDYAYLDDGRLDTVTVTEVAGNTTSVERWRYAAGASCSLAWANSLFAHLCIERP